MDHAEADRIKQWLLTFHRTIRMEYGQAMALAGFSPDIIVEVQQTVAENMVEWLQAN